MRVIFFGSFGRFCSFCFAFFFKVVYYFYFEDYGDIEIGFYRSFSSNLGTDDGYMFMIFGVVFMGGGSGSCRSDDYMFMSFISVFVFK